VVDPIGYTTPFFLAKALLGLGLIDIHHKLIKPSFYIMANITPSQLFPGYQLAGATAVSATNALVIPLAALPALTAAEAGAAGDGREVARALIEQITASIEGLAAVSKPNKMSAVRSNPTGTGQNTISQTYSQTFQVALNQAQASLVAEA
jgi:hypothetical protein